MIVERSIILNPLVLMHDVLSGDARSVYGYHKSIKDSRRLEKIHHTLHPFVTTCEAYYFEHSA